MLYKQTKNENFENEPSYYVKEPNSLFKLNFSVNNGKYTFWYEQPVEGLFNIFSSKMTMDFDTPVTSANFQVIKVII